MAINRSFYDRSIGAAAADSMFRHKHHPRDILTVPGPIRQRDEQGITDFLQQTIAARVTSYPYPKAAGPAEGPVACAVTRFRFLHDLFSICLIK